MQDVLHVLSPSGIFLFASPSVQDLTGYTPEELVGRAITDFIEQDDMDNFITRFTDSIHTDRPLTTYFRFRRKDMTFILFEVTGQPYYTTSSSPIPSSSSSYIKNNMMDPPTLSKTCKCFFAMARQYPGKNNAMLDSFLELKMENENLRQRLAEIYREIEGEPEDPSLSMGTMAIDLSGNAADQRQISGYPSRVSAYTQQQQQQQPHQPQTNFTGTATDDTSSGSNGNNNNYYTYTNSNITQPPHSYQNKQAQQAQSQSFADPAQLQASAPLNQDTLQGNPTGLIPSTSNTYGSLGIGISPTIPQRHHNKQNTIQVQGQQNQNQNQNHSFNLQNASSLNQSINPSSTLLPSDGQDPMMESDGKTKKKPKKQRVDEGEFVCRDCGTVDSPEWRRGPLGPKTLCNAVSRVYSLRLSRRPLIKKMYVQWTVRTTVG